MNVFLACLNIPWLSKRAYRFREKEAIGGILDVTQLNYVNERYMQTHPSLEILKCLCVLKEENLGKNMCTKLLLSNFKSSKDSGFDAK